jgi:hypothetical protein
MAVEREQQENLSLTALQAIAQAAWALQEAVKVIQVSNPAVSAAPFPAPC